VELRLLEQVLVVPEVDARLAADALDDLKALKVILVEAATDVVEEGTPEAGQEVLCGILLPLALLHLLGLFLSSSTPNRAIPFLRRLILIRRIRLP
jgi:hypothetical protein